jgi:hypothetical protein
MNPKAILKHIIRPTLAHLAKTEPRLEGAAAENLMLGTGLVESFYSKVVQIKGPALGPWQIEPMTFDDVYGRYLPIQRIDLLGAVNGLLIPALKPRDQLAVNMLFNCAIARIRYWMAPEPLPDSEDIEGLGLYHKRHYNTMLGKADPAEFVKRWRKYCRK